jgi:AcrR family transcriptional regulator
VNVTIRERQAALTRGAVLAAARRLFAESGFASTAVRPIAQAAGVSVQTLYAIFGSKQGILIALVETIREQTDAPALWTKIAASDDPDEIIRIAAHLRRQVLERCGDIVATFREGAAGDPEVAASYAEGQARSRQGIARMCTRLGQLGVRVDSRSADQVAALFAAEVYEELTGPRSGWSPDAYEDWLANVLRAALLGSPAPDPE